jgi:hypothetical protein
LSFCWLAAAAGTAGAAGIKQLYQTEVESWRELQSQNIEFTMKRLREPVEAGGGSRVEATLRRTDPVDARSPARHP